MTLTHAQSGNTIHIEWFDTEIDSIIEIDGTGNRSYRDCIWIKNEKIDENQFERKVGKINGNLLENLSGSTIFLIGCDFHPNLEVLRKYANIHFTDFHREDSTSLDVGVPDIPHIDALKHYIEENSSKANICFYTKNEKSVQDFLEFHALSGCQIIPTPKSGLESCEYSETFFLDPEGWGFGGGNRPQRENQEETVQNRVDTPETFVTFGHESKGNVSKKI